MNNNRVTFADKNIKETTVLYIDSVPIATLGNISALVGKPKCGKTLNLSAMVAAGVTSAKVLNYFGRLPANKGRIIYIDTEQSKLHCYKQLNRIAELANVSEAFLMDKLYFYALREYSPNQRIDFIAHVLENISNIGLLVIDGIRDLLYDINCPTQSSQLINTLMMWSSKYNMHIITVLHLNKSDDNTRGHLGSELNNKAECVVKIIKKELKSNLCSVVPLYTRDKEFSSFTFLINNNGLPELTDNCISDSLRRGIRNEDITEEQHRQALNKALGPNVMTGYENLKEAVKNAYGSIGLDFGYNRIVSLIKYLKANNILVAEGKGYKYNEDFII